MMAARGERNTSDTLSVTGNTIKDPVVVKQVRRRAVSIVRHSTGIGIVVTLVYWILKVKK